MDYQLSDAYKRLIETRDALERLCHEMTGSWPLEHETADDIAARIKHAVTRERETAAREQERLL
jgi:hypothetical protein